MLVLTKADIVGRAIREVRAAGGMEGDCEVVRVFYLLDNGVAFRLPLAGFQFTMEAPPQSAEAVSLPQVEGRSIAAVVCEVVGGEPRPDSVCLLLDDGSLLTDVAFAPQGVGAAGVHLIKTGDVDHGSLRDFWGLEERGP